MIPDPQPIPPPLPPEAHPPIACAQALPAPILPAIEPRSTTPVVLAQVAIVLMVGVVPDFLSSAASLIFAHPHHAARPFWYAAVYIIARSIVVSGVTLGMICWARERWGAFGFRPPRWRDIPWTFAAAFGSVFLYYTAAIAVAFGASIVDSLFGAQIPLESSYRFPTVRQDSDVLWLMAMSLCNGMAEELVMRAFLIPRFERIFGGGAGASALALVATTVIFASYHAYQGIYGIVGALAAGLVFGLIFLKTRSIWPIFLAHALMDAFALLMMGAGR